MAHGLMEIIFTSAGTKVSNTELFLRKIKTPRLFICHSANGKHEKLGENPSKKSWGKETHLNFRGETRIALAASYLAGYSRSWRLDHVQPSKG
jgi:hypothetical protein